MPIPNPETPAPKATDTTSAANVVTVQLLQGQLYGWPLFQLHAWELTRQDDADVLRLTLGGKLVRIEGFALKKIVTLLAEGKGVLLVESGARYASTVPAGELFIKTITFEDPDQAVRET